MVLSLGTMDRPLLSTDNDESATFALRNGYVHYCISSNEAQLLVMKSRLQNTHMMPLAFNAQVFWPLFCSKESSRVFPWVVTVFRIFKYCVCGLNGYS